MPRGRDRASGGSAYSPFTAGQWAPLPGAGFGPGAAPIGGPGPSMPIAPISGFQSGPAVGPVSAPGGGLSLGGVPGDVWDWIKKNPEIVLAGLGAIQNARAAGRANNLQEQAIGIAMADYNARAPLRDMAMAKLQAPLPAGVNLSDVFADAGNPYARSVAPVPGGAGPVGTQLPAIMNQGGGIFGLMRRARRLPGSML